MEKAAIVNYEEMGANAHVALNSMQYDGWILRFSEGHTCRANSVSVIYPSSIDPVEKIAFCEKMYARQDLPCVFKLTDGDEELNELLVKRGYTVVTPTDVMELGLSGVESVGEFGDDSMMLRSDGDATLSGDAGTDVIFFNEPTAEWLTPYFAFEGFNENKQNIYSVCAVHSRSVMSDSLQPRGL